MGKGGIMRNLTISTAILNMQIRQLYKLQFKQFDIPNKEEYLVHILVDFGDDWCIQYKTVVENVRSSYQKSHFFGKNDLDLHSHHVTF